MTKKIFEKAKRLDATLEDKKNQLEELQVFIDELDRNHVEKITIKFYRGEWNTILTDEFAFQESEKLLNSLYEKRLNKLKSEISVLEKELDTILS